MSALFEITTYVFRKIDPAKKFAEFSYYDVDFEQVNCGDCQKDTVLKINGTYYLYSGSRVYYSDTKVPAAIYFMDGRKKVKSIAA